MEYCASIAGACTEYSRLHYSTAVLSVGSEQEGDRGGVGTMEKVDLICRCCMKYSNYWKLGALEF